MRNVVSILLVLGLAGSPAASWAQGGASSVPAQDTGAALAASVEQAWIADTKLPAYLLAAKVRDGKLQLFGAVSTKQQHAQAVAIAKKLAGKTPVADHIAVTKTAVQSGTPVGAAKGAPTAVPSQDVGMAVADTVEQAWIADGKVPYYLIAAKVRDGSLQLYGAVETAAQHDAAVAIAKQAAGDMPVADHIAVTKIASQSPAPKKK
jgi:osmotically-inducible protein OsmY